jgi:hypothetical protein
VLINKIKLKGDKDEKIIPGSFVPSHIFCAGFFSTTNLDDSSRQ